MRRQEKTVKTSSASAWKELSPTSFPFAYNACTSKDVRRLQHPPKSYSRASNDDTGTRKSNKGKRTKNSKGVQIGVESANRVMYMYILSQGG